MLVVFMLPLLLLSSSSDFRRLRATSSGAADPSAHVSRISYLSLRACSSSSSLTTTTLDREQQRASIQIIIVPVGVFFIHILARALCEPSSKLINCISLSLTHTNRRLLAGGGAQE